jgi:hypothetical protein
MSLPYLYRLDMMRAGVVTHLSDWAHSGYREIQNPPKRYGMIDLRGLSPLCGFSVIAESWIHFLATGQP